MSNLWNQLRHVWANTDWSWIVLWFGLSMLIVALVVLMRTRWGQSRPIGKCAVLSLAAHLLLAIYATTIQIVTASAGRSGDHSIHATLVDGEDWSEDEATPQRPFYDSVAGDPQTALLAADLEPLHVSDRAVLETAPLPADVSSTSKSQSLPEIAPPLPSTVPALPLQSSNGSRQPAESIDEPSPAPAASKDVIPEVATLNRLMPAEIAVPNASAPHHGSESSKEARDAGVADLLNVLPNPSSFNAGDGSAFRQAQLPSVAASAPEEGTFTKTSTTRSSQGPGSPVMPVKTTSDGAEAVPRLYQDRVAGDREVLARRRGGSAESEAAVQAALQWLAGNQSSDGRWDADRFGAGKEEKILGQDRQGAGARADTAMTGLALLTFLGAGNTHLEGKYKDHVKRGLEHLLNAQAADGNLAGDAELYAFMYSHGIATLAVSEAYALTHDKRLEDTLRAAIAYTVSAQHAGTGSWRYRPNDPGDMSQFGWQWMALKSAELSGIAIPESTRLNAIRVLKSASAGAHGGLASYRPRERVTRPMTAEALVCRQFLGISRDDPAVNEAGDYLLGQLPSTDQINLYYWYYGTLAMYQLQGDRWQRWNEALQNTLVKRQVMAGENAGSWEPDCLWAGYGGRVYSTAMSALCLEVYYRYLPLYGEFGPDVREAKREP